MCVCMNKVDAEDPRPVINGSITKIDYICMWIGGVVQNEPWSQPKKKQEEKKNNSKVKKREETDSRKESETQKTKVLKI